MTISTPSISRLLVTMKIEIIGVCAQSEGEQILLTLKITDDEGVRTQKRKLLIFTDK